MEGSRENSVGQVFEANAFDEVIGDMFPEIGEDVEVRPLLKMSELVTGASAFRD